MPAAKKATPAKKAAAKKAPAKSAPAKKTAPAKKAAPAKATAASNGGRDAKRLAEVAKLRKGGMSIADIADQQGRNAAIVGADYIFATEPRAGVPITAARVKKDRDGGMGWVTIAARYSAKGQADVTKAQVQKLYRDAGGDVNGKPAKKAAPTKATAAKKAAAPAKMAAAAPTTAAEKRAAKKAAKAAASSGDPIFSGEETKEEVTAKIESKTITLNRGMDGESYKVGTVTAVGKSGKMGGRAVQFYDKDTGGARTILLVDIVKVSR